MGAQILVIGETCKDIFYYGRCERLCPEAPAPVFEPIKIVSNPGMATNVQRNILALGKECDICTNDNWEKITKTRYIHKNTNQMFIRVDENDTNVERCDVKKIPFSEYEIIVISDYCKGFLTKEDIEYIGSKHECVFLDTKKRLGKWCETASYIKINNYEYEKTVDALDIPQPVRDKTIVTLGPRGCQYQNKVYPVKSVEIKDVSGAGDTFLSSLVVKYLDTKDIKRSLAFANECATIVVQKRGVSVV